MSINLTGGIPDWFVDEFQGNLYHVQQQKVSKFAQAVRTVPLLNAEDKAFDMMGKLALVAKNARNEQTPTTDPTTGRRWVSTDPYHQSVLYDKDDDLQMIIKPESDFMTSLRMAVNRKKDDIILAAIDGTVTSGRRAGSSITWASQLGTTKYTLTSGGRTIAHDTAEGNADASKTGLTVEKIELVKEYFGANEFDEDTPIWGAISPRQATNLFGQEEYVSNDYQNGKPFTTGRIIKNWMGINWIVSNKIVKGSSNDVDADTNVFRLPFWIQDGIVLAVADEITTRITEESTLSYSQRVYVHMNMGAMRLDEDKVCYVECQ
jgi:hypothetical protein